MGPDWLNVVWTFCGGWLLNKMELCLDLRINTLDIEYGDKTESIFSTSWQTQMFYADIYYERRTRLCHLSLYTQSGERPGPGRPLLILCKIEVFCQETGNILNTTFTSGQNDWHLKKFSTRRILQDDSVTRLVYTSSHGGFWRANSSLSSGPDISPDQPLIYWDFIHRLWPSSGISNRKILLENNIY